jgi:hypothetical protein
MRMSTCAACAMVGTEGQFKLADAGEFDVDVAA